jgi:hypothetical protein
MQEQDPKTGLRLLRQEVEQLRSEMRECLQRLAGLETTLAKVTANSETVAMAPAAETNGEITPERMALIAAVVTTFLGRKVKIHQARQVNPEVVSPWAQQGRVFVQASHALARH